MSYTAAVVFSPLAYPGYDWMAQAVSDLSASNAPSLRLWNQLSSLYNVCTLVCAMMVCVGIQGKKTRLLRVGIYLFTIVLLSIVSLVLIIIAGANDKSCRSYGIFAAIALGMMMVGAIGMRCKDTDAEQKRNVFCLRLFVMATRKICRRIIMQLNLT